MSKQQVKAGGYLEIPSVDEIVQPATDRILKHLGKNARFIRDVTGNTSSDGAGNFKIQNGPADGFLWSILMVAVDVGNTTGTYFLYVNNTTPIAQVSQLLTGSGVTTYSKSQLILKSNDVLIVQNAGVAAALSYPVKLRIDAIEVPTAHEAQLLL